MEKIKYIYILSQRYSGSTLLSYLLGTHPDIATIGERRKFYVNSWKTDEHPDQRLCSCGTPFYQCSHWNEIKSSVYERLKGTKLSSNATEFKIFNHKLFNQIASEMVKYSLIRGLKWSKLPFKKRLEELLHFNQVLVEEILRIQQKPIFLDSSKTIDHILYLSQIERFDFYVIWLTRDPRAQVCSALKYNDWSIEKAAHEWNKEMKRNEKLLNQSGIRFTQLTYEDLCKAPNKEMKRLLEFIGADVSTYSLDFRSYQQHIMGNYSMRLGSDSKIEERKEWKAVLNENEVDTINRLTTEYEQFYAR